MFNKKIIYFAILVIGLLAISSVHASEIDLINHEGDVNDLQKSHIINEDLKYGTIEENIVYSEEDNLKIVNNISNNMESELDNHISHKNVYPDEKSIYQNSFSDSLYLNEKSFENIQKDINLAEEGSTIGLTGIYIGNGTQIIINKSLTIEGIGDTVLDAQGLSRIFNINSTNVILKNLNFQNGLIFGRNSVEYGGAINWVGNGSVVNCTFINNSASRYGGSGAINWVGNGSVVNCTFINNSAYYSGGAFLWVGNGSVVNCTFRENYSNGSGGALYLKGDSLIDNCTFINNSIYVNTEGGAIYSERNCSVINCDFINNSGCFTCTGGAISCHYKSKLINCTFFNNLATNGGAAYVMGEGLINNCSFKNNSVDDMPMLCLFESNCTILDCNFENNTQGIEAKYSNTSVRNCSFLNNGASAYWYGNSSIRNCSFINQSGPIYMDDGVYSVYDSSFIKNVGALHLSGNGSVVNCTFRENIVEGSGGAIYNSKGYASIINSSFDRNYAKVKGDNIYNYGILYLSGNIINSKLATIYNNYYENYYYEDTSIINSTIYLVILNNATNVKSESTGFKVFAQLTDDMGNLIEDSKVNIFVGNQKYAALFDGNSRYEFNLNDEIGLPSIISGYYDGASNLIVKTGKIVNIIKTKIYVPKVTAVYNVTKKIVVTLKDTNGKILSNKKIKVKVGSISKTLTTNSKGQVSLVISNLVPKSYTAAVSFLGDYYYAKSSTTAKVVVKKATPKLTASAKTFKVKVKTKKYTITLKNNKGAVMKSTKVTLKVNGKTYSAKTNSKGVATFKITNLKKKGTFTAVVTYAGSKYYNKVTKKPKITVKK